MAEFKVVSDFDLMGDQPEAVDTLAKGILDENEHRRLWESPDPARRLLWQN